MTRSFLLLFLFIILACNAPPAERVLLDFESDAELDRLYWKCRTLYHLSDKHATHGAKSLKVSFYPSEFPGLAPEFEEDDWSGHRRLLFDIYNPDRDAAQIVVRIDDRIVAKYENRYNQIFSIKSGANQINIPLDGLITSGSKRKLDLDKIKRLLIFMVNPTEKKTLYFDHVRLIAREDA